MKLAVALQERADINRKIEELKKRLKSNVLIQEGESPEEEPNSLKSELDSTIARLGVLIAKINLTNSQTVIDGKTLTELIAQKDALQLSIYAYKEIVDVANQKTYRSRNTEIKIKTAISVVDWQKRIDALSKELRLLDIKIQETNWKIDLIE
ncbi:MAG: DIP1984 family protein [Thermoguttaceae bacterium]